MLLPPVRLSRAVVLGGARRVPAARLGENTLLLADELVVTQAADGRWFVAVRCERDWGGAGWPQWGLQGISTASCKGGQVGRKVGRWAGGRVDGQARHQSVRWSRGYGVGCVWR